MLGKDIDFGCCIAVSSAVASSPTPPQADSAAEEGSKNAVDESSRIASSRLGCSAILVVAQLAWPSAIYL